ncbi:MAG: recombination protein F [Pelotomaculum sp. PtaB.Bin013]|uniref:AAA family ATPase n=1 Tax=Pelotomaculum isophthalicicum JI TaxID=947010 RepID=A0A9X4H567_9FIRM|nr:AAA family ATPase [Pelotomaculum isophthalicicum]MDF9408222.1 AAA family ATPase [Pelotomaculum isophthalicicum JI]OPX81380.1 MAG: recombination protein F [Pelotomaculum sp. PtaB.Bin013]
MITEIHVKNYRSLGDVTLNLGNLTVLVGPNGSGKSNLIDAIRFVSEALQLGLDSAIKKRHGIAMLRRWSPKKNPHDVLMEFNLKGNKTDNPFSAKYGFTLKSERDGRISVKKEYCTVNWRKKNAEYLYEKGVPVKPVSTGLTPPVNEDSFVLSAIGGTEPFSYVRSALVNTGFCSIFPDTIRYPQNPGGIEISLEERGSNLAAILKNMKKQGSKWLPDIKSALSKVVPDIKDFQVQQIGGYLVIKFLHTGLNEDHWFDVSQESDGTLRVLGLLTAIYHDPSMSLLAVEEPELTIHPGALAVLSDILLEAGTRTQLLLTTHSPDLISRLPVDSLRAVEKLDGVTLINEIDETQRRVIEQRLFSAGDLLRLEGLNRRADEGVR